MGRFISRFTGFKYLYRTIQISYRPKRLFICKDVVGPHGIKM